MIATHRACCCLLGALLVVSAASADGPADNIPENVRRVPKLGIELKPEVKKELEDRLAALTSRLDTLLPASDAQKAERRADVAVLLKGVRDAIKYQEFFVDRDVATARQVLKTAEQRLNELSKGNTDSLERPGVVARGYVSKIDGSVQPYGLVLPPNYNGKVPGKFRLDVWFHGRGETLGEVQFLGPFTDPARKTYGEFTPPDTIVLHPYGRYCNANKFAGEVDVLEAIEHVKAHYRIDPDRIAVRGFSMGGAACWQFAVHYPDRWFAANPGAGFSETPRFLKVFQRETLQPTWYEQKLWRMYDCDLVAVNLAQCPTVAYSGELDSQKQAADVMVEALAKEGIDLVHVIGPQTKHAYHPKAKVEVEGRLASIASKGRERIPRHVRFATYTLKYNTMNWVTIDAMAEHWERASVDAIWAPVGSESEPSGNNLISVRPQNVTRVTLDFPSGLAPMAIGSQVTVQFPEGDVPAGRVLSDRSFHATFAKGSSGWTKVGPDDGLVRKRHDLQGPIDDAFMDSFVFVRPTGKSANPKIQAWVESEMNRAIEHWRRHFRGEARVIEDTQLTDAISASSHVVLWGDPASNAALAKLAGKLPIGWDASGIKAGAKSFDAENHALILIAPNPQNPARYVVLNSGFTFRDYDYLNNARQTPKLPDWAVIDVRTPPNSRFPGKVVEADFFDEQWKLKAK